MKTLDGGTRQRRPSAFGSNQASVSEGRRHIRRPRFAPALGIEQVKICSLLISKTTASSNSPFRFRAPPKHNDFHPARRRIYGHPSLHPGVSLHTITRMLETTRRRVLDTLNSRCLYGRVVRAFLQVMTP